MQATFEKPTGYLIPVGKADDERLTALGAIYNPISMKLLESSTISKNPKILDVGCGNGELTALFAKVISGSTVVGVDISPAQIEVAKAKAEEQSLSNVSWELCDVHHLEDLKTKHPELFDIVHSRFVLSHLPNPAGAVDPMLSMVKPGGLLIIEEMGAKKAFKEPLPKPIQAWKKMVDLQHQLQQSHKDTIERVVKHLENSENVTCRTVLFNIKIEGQQKKSMFRIGVEQGLKKLAEMGRPELIKTFGYDNGGTWLREMKSFELDGSMAIEAENYESIIVSRN